MKKIEIVEAFILALGDVREWECVGFAEGEEHCICGHAIYNQFIIENVKTKEKAIVGSECIEHFHYYSPALYEALKKSEKKFKEKKKSEKKAIKREESLKAILPLIEKHNLLYNKILEAWDIVGGAYQKVDYDIWWVKTNYKIENIDKLGSLYKTLGGWFNYFVKSTKTLESYIKDFEDRGIYKKEKYTPPKWDGKIWFGKHAGTEIEKIDKKYLNWVYENFIPHSPADYDRVDSMKDWIKNNSK